MTEQWSSAHLMFCEGAHDAAFLNRLLKVKLKFEKAQLKLSELPYPISDVIIQSFKTRAGDDLRLDMARKFFLPDYLLARDATLVMIFSYGGSNRQASMSPFLENVFALLGAPAFSRASQPAFTYSVFADADHRGLNDARNQVSADLSVIGGSQWLGKVWKDVEGTRAAVQESAFGPIAVYIWKKWAEDNGTLEDIMVECLSGESGLQQTLEFLDARFAWRPEASATFENEVAAGAKRLKAAFCVEGQHKKPGGSLAVILDQADLLSGDAMERSQTIKDCLTFLHAWLAPAPRAAAASSKSASPPGSLREAD